MTRLHGLAVALCRLTRVDLAFLHFKAALGIMLMFPLSQAGSVQMSTPTEFVVAWLIISWTGFVVSAIGLILSAQRHETRRLGLRVEMTGLCLMLAGPLGFIGVQVGIWITTGQDKGLAIAFCYVIASAIFARMVMVKSCAKSRTVIVKYLEKKEADSAADGD